MSNVIGLSAYHEENLRKLAAYLLSGELKAKFNMGYYAHNGSATATKCGSVGCAIGHGPHAGIEKIVGESWGIYGNRVFGELLWSWAFSSFWEDTDNIPDGAARRILWALDKGIPKNSEDQKYGDAPLCYI